MKKRGQITLILGFILFLVIVIGLFYYLKYYNMKNTSANIIKKGTEGDNLDIVKAYGESCLKKVTEDALFNKIGIHAGYINPDGDPAHGDEGVPGGSRQPSVYLGNKVPYFIDGSSAQIPDLNQISGKLSNYITVEFGKCFDTNIFESIGMNITKPAEGVNAQVSLNEEDVSVKLDYPTLVKENDVQSSIDSFRVVLPIRLKSLYADAVTLVQNIRNAQPNAYHISSDCRVYNTNGLTNVYIKTSSSGARDIVQFVDFSTYRERYFHSFIFQFAVNNVNVEGSCAG